MFIHLTVHLMVGRKIFNIKINILYRANIINIKYILCNFFAYLILNKITLYIIFKMYIYAL